MNNSYQFNAIEHKKFMLSATVPTVLSIFITTAILLIFAIYSPSIGSDVSGIIFILILCFFIVFIVLKLLTGMAKETWNIRFDLNTITIGSNKRETKTYSLLALNKITFTKVVTNMGSSHTICFVFDSLNQKVYLDLPLTYLYSIANKDDLSIFLQFVTSFNEQIIERQFKLISGKEQKAIGHSGRRFDIPAKFIFVRKNNK